ncbi:MAG: GNAT family N-acetyltransferase [Thermoguttaceae bacterium]
MNPARRAPVAGDASGDTAGCARAATKASRIAGNQAVSLLWGRAGLEKLVADRNRLATTLDAQRLDNFLDWHASCMDAGLPDPDDLCFGVVSQGDRTAAIIPFERSLRRLFGLKIAGLEMSQGARMPMGDPLVTDGADPDACLTAVLGQLSRAIRPCWQYIRVVNVRADNACAMAVVRQPGFSRLRAGVNGCAWCPVVPQEQVLQRVSKNFAAKLRKNRKRLAATEGVTFATVSTLPELEKAYEEFLQVEAASWKGAEGSRTAILLMPRLKVLHEQVMRRFGKRGRCEIHLLRLGGRPIAGQYTLMTDDTVYLPKIGYDQAFQHLSPGVMLLDYLFRRWAGDPAIKYINLTTNMPWMKGWRLSCDDVFNLYLFRRTLRGQIARAYWLAAQTIEHHRCTWAAPLFRRLVGSRARRYRRRQDREARDEQ